MQKWAKAPVRAARTKLETAMAAIANPVQVLGCPTSRRLLRWPGAQPFRGQCPPCRARLIVRRVVAESTDAVSEVICDWLDPFGPDAGDEPVESEPTGEANAVKPTDDELRSAG